MEKVIVTTDQAPAAIGPYSQAIRSGDLIFTAGQLGTIPATRQLAGTDIESQTRQALENLRAVLEAAGSCLDHVLKTTVFVVDLGEFARMNAVYATFFPQVPPARSTVQVSALPARGRVEIEAIAVACDCSRGKEDCGCS
jgi:2-iminobutanoate/2-iminopropanoate deaminase